MATQTHSRATSPGMGRSFDTSSKLDAVDGDDQASNKPDDRPGGRRLVVPTVSVASLDEHGNWTMTAARPQAGGGHSSAGSTTSEVNSLDGAESIASRLSQIADEQEFRMQELAGRKVSADNARTDTPARGQTNRLRTNSFAAGQQADPKPQTSSLAKRRDGSSGALCSSGSTHHQQQQFQPERGNLKALGKQRPLDKDGGNLRTHRSHTELVSADRLEAGELTLNIRRSAWKLDEFDQVCRQLESDEETSARRETSNLMASAAGSRLEPREPPGPTKAASAADYRQRSNSSSSCGSLLARASHRLALGKRLSSGLTSGAHLAIASDRRLSQPDAKIAQSAAGDHPSDGKLFHTGALADTMDLLGSGSGKRRGSNRSLVSLASSFGSANSSDRRRPFAPAGGQFGSDATAARSSRHKRRREHSKAAGAKSGGESGGGGGGGWCPCSYAQLKRFVPALEWLPAYRWRGDFGADLMAGLVVATINIPTSVSAAVVAQTDLSAAVRSSIFNAIVYAILCTSRHNSFGSWSIMSQMLLDSVRRALSDELVLSRIHSSAGAAEWNSEQYEMWHMNIIVMYTFLIGLIQLLAGCLNLGNLLASFIPEALCSSMISATAFTMAVGQLANMCGTSNKLLWAIERNSTSELNWADLKPRERVSITDLFVDLFRWLQQVALLVTHRQQINLVACAISLTTVILLVLNNYLQPRLRAWLKRDLVVPFEMLLMIGWIFLGHLLDLRDAYKVTTCDPITLQFKLPGVPNLRLVRELWFDSLATALISFTIVFIMAKTNSSRFNYEIDNNQELIACGAGNLIGGLFDALPATASISRTTGQVEAGGRTQMATLVNCFALVGLVQCLGEHVAHLPLCVMSATLFYGFARMMRRTSEVLDYWRLCRVDFAIWVFTYASILTFDLVTGFLYGFIFSLVSMLYRAQNPRCYLLGSVGSSDVYVPPSRYPLAHELDGIKIFQFCGPIHYACADLFERRLRQKTRVDIKAQLKQLEQQQPHQADSSRISIVGEHPLEFGESKPTKVGEFDPPNASLPTHIILDFSMISFLDTAGVRVIKKVIADYQRLNITVMLASLASHVAQVVKKDPELWENHKDRFYLTLADAVQHALRDNKLTLDLRRHLDGPGSS